MEDNKNNDNQVKDFTDELEDKQDNVKTGNGTTDNNPPEYLQGYKNLYVDDYKFTDVYVPRPDNKKEKHKKHWGISVAIISILIIFSLALGSLIGFGGAMLTYGQMAGEQNTDTTAPLSTVKTNGSELPITYSEQDIINRSLTVAQAASLVKDSVVEISTETRVVSNNGYTINSGAGSGVIIDGNGYIVTNNHVIDGAGTITVKLTNGNTYAATLIGTDEASDIALISIKPEEELTVATFGDSDKIVLGETVIAVGNPLGELGGTITDGIISATERRVIVNDSEMTLIQTNAAVSPGNSGGGLFNMAGELIGIVNAKSADEYAEGLAFAIPVNKAGEIITALDEYGYVKGQVDTNLGLSLWESPYGGVYVQKSNGDFVEEDIIVKVDGYNISSTSNIKSVLRGKKVGDTVEVTVSRGGRGNRKQYTYSVTLTEYVPSTVELQ